MKSVESINMVHIARLFVILRNLCNILCLCFRLRVSFYNHASVYQLFLKIFLLNIKALKVLSMYLSTLIYLNGIYLID